MRLLSYLPQQRMVDLRWLLAVSFIPGLLDFVSIAIIGRLTGSLVGGRLDNLVPGIKVFGGNQFEQALWLIGLFVSIIWIQSLVRIFLRVMQERTASAMWLDFSKRIFEGIVDQPYEFHITNNVSKLSADLLGSLECLLVQIITPVLRAFSSIIVICILTIGIIYVGGLTAIAMILIMIASYIAMSFLITPALRMASSRKIRTRNQFTQTFLESFKSIKDIKLTGNKGYFIDKFVQSTLEFKRADTQSLVLPEVPRMLIEAIGITVIFSFGVLPAVLSGNSVNVLDSLPFLAALSIGSLRLSKPLQDLFTAVSKIRGGLPELNGINQLLMLKDNVSWNASSASYSPNGIMPKRSISLANASFSYPGSNKLVLESVDLVIPIGSRVAFVGATGSGKSTTAALLLGLFFPKSGFMNLDGIPLAPEDVQAWHACCSEVPQNIHLLDDSVYANVAFGLEEDQIDFDRVWEALEAAQLLELVDDLPFGIHTHVGENGINLSGGQRQRIALARAFYRQSQFLILDEATSALDNQTESDVLQALEIVGRRCTTLVIAHRLSTIQRCDRIFEFANGRLIASGSFEELRRKSPSFERLVKIENTGSL
jgi:ATP-binding cassette subfamily B protein|tara:strand:+ start:968 stop:2761 length:1794 start_codon:yes stop_codon:yes gene_type:complete